MADAAGRWHRDEKLRFLVVGGVNTLIGYGIFLTVLAAMQLAIASSAVPSEGLMSYVARNYYLIAQWSAWVIAVPVNALTLKHFVFLSDGRLRGEIARAYLVYLPVLALNSVILWVAVEKIGVTPVLGQAAAVAVITVLSYLGHKYFTFRAS